MNMLNKSILTACMATVVAALFGATLQAQAPAHLYYRFNEGTGTTTANLGGGGTASPTFSAAPTWVTPGILGAAHRTGAAFLPTGLTVNLTATDSWTIEFWMNGTSGTFGYIFGDNTASNFRCFAAGAAGAANITIRGTGLTNLDVPNANNGTNHHIAISYDGAGNMRTYIDGVASNFNTGQAPALNFTNLQVGGLNGASLFAGAIDEFRFWNVARTPAQIAANMSVEIATTAPELDITRGASPIADGGTDTVTGTTAGTATVLSYTLTNSGTANVTMSSNVVSGQTNCTATISTAPFTPIVPAGTTTAGYTVTPTAAGAWSFVVTIANNDANENPYNWTISGTAAAAAAPECDVTRGGAVADGGTDTVTGGSAGTASVLTYTITNSGTAALTITTPVVAPAGLVNCTASISTQPAASTAAAGTTTLGVTVTPTAAGAFSCTVTFANNDATENPYNWTISGTATAPAPECDVTRGGAVADGGTDTVTGGVAATASVLTYTITNSGTAALTITTPVVAPAALVNCTATITTQPAASTGGCWHHHAWRHRHPDGRRRIQLHRYLCQQRR